MKSSHLLAVLICLVSLAAAGLIIEQTLAKRAECDHSKTHSISGGPGGCKDGYENTAPFWGAGQVCTQIGRSTEEFK